MVFDGGEYHLFAAAMTNGCLLKHWGSNSRVEHAVSADPLGPFVFRDVAVGVQAHNPAPLRLADGRWVIYHIGQGNNGTNGGRPCHDRPCCLPKCSACPGSSSFAPPSATSDSKQRAANIWIAEWAARANDDAVLDVRRDPPLPVVAHVANSPYGPWLPLHLTGEFVEGCINPAPWQLSNGTIYLICGSSILLRSESLTGPYDRVAFINRSLAPVPVIEDAALWVDGEHRWHALFHGFSRSGGQLCYGQACEAPLCANTTVSAHAFSLDGIEWHWSQTQPYTATTELEGGSSVHSATRERPKPFIDSRGRLSHLVTAVVDVPHCGRTNDSCANCKTQGYGTHTDVSQLLL
jgi:hypothetical protein